MIGADSSFRRRVLLLLDNNFITTPERDARSSVLQTYLDQKFDGSYEWSVVAVGDEIRVLVPFTDDKLLVRSALDRVSSLPTFASRYRVDRHFLNDPVRVRRSQRSAAASESGDPTRRRISRRSLRFESKVSVASTLQAFERTTTAMIQAFRAYAICPETRSWSGSRAAFRCCRSTDSKARAPRGRTDLAKDTELREYQTELRKLVDAASYEANAAQFKVYPVKATGLEPQTPQNDPSFRSSGASFQRDRALLVDRGRRQRHRAALDRARHRRPLPHFESHSRLVRGRRPGHDELLFTGLPADTRRGRCPPPGAGRGETAGPRRAIPQRPTSTSRRRNGSRWSSRRRCRSRARRAVCR